MNPEEKEILKKTLELSQENNNMLHSIRRGMFWGRVMRVIYWVVIIGVGIGVYYYIEPYLNGAIDAYGNVKGDLKSFSDLFTK
ncbi:MAG: hypothetical protein UR80_C0047G0005 [Parcubacteria group bacterium GW2011_GWB1_35_5]|uniref:Uncharacterized protein n=1 Tax=Candidatus Zambryskibacteria bacterium RIFCSPLOWO2_01_FULL_35_19 TaxID=1802757 RepID=A0A1G2TYV2_9BACT|nr:MAG: hypothetical protein UR50_C0011G0014 [Parcubacteria group bacterium GW2011_GWC1_34_10]KKP79704.1 MAG: hypothetical protein UR80_C0047G0005 [Parcubacteria group bacterium GW2011_GWB1_35_5]OHA86863.1 MAG: hypothetical protein A2726_00765 [Candidatus Zambryskibacteria bacterium RIFCSPHIGHO2_01_FULL_35_32]OHB02486.1 MAG: hypothetical protein A3A90_00370 [Candidatus Zambryskibacteria bacterium RIFCSPLOWO2_01_FULL_35_19]